MTIHVYEDNTFDIREGPFKKKKTKRNERKQAKKT